MGPQQGRQIYQTTHYIISGNNDISNNWILQYFSQTEFGLLSFDLFYYIPLYN